MFRKHYDKLVQWQNMLADVQVYFAFFNILTVNSLLNVDKRLIRVLVKFAFNFFKFAVDRNGDNFKCLSRKENACLD